MKIKKDTLISDVLKYDADATSPLLLNIGMDCLVCPATSSETVEEACKTHGVDVDLILGQLNKAIEKE